MPDAKPPRRILLTGSAGAIGRRVAPALVAAGHDVRGFDRAPSPTLPQHVVGDITDEAALDRAMADRDTLVHLAAHPHPGPLLGPLLEANVVGLYRTLHAAVRHGISRVVLASTMQVIGGARTSDGRPIRTDAMAPMNDYALTKVWAEELGRMLARQHDVTVLIVRIGWFARQAEEMQRIGEHHGGPASYLSHDDAARFFNAAVRADLSDEPGRSATVYAVGPGVGPDEPGWRYDLEPGRRLLGYEPRDAFPVGSAFGKDA